MKDKTKPQLKLREQQHRLECIFKGGKKPTRREWETDEDNIKG